MKSEIPFNPLPLPETLNLSLKAGPEQASQNKPQPKRKAKRTATKSKRPGSKATPVASLRRWHQIKGRLAARMAQVDKEKLKEVLLACGVAAGLAIAVVIAMKLLPIAAVILAALGLGAALRFWERLRYMPRPF